MKLSNESVKHLFRIFVGNAKLQILLRLMKVKIKLAGVILFFKDTPDEAYICMNNPNLEEKISDELVTITVYLIFVDL